MNTPRAKEWLQLKKKVWDIIWKKVKPPTGQRCFRTLDVKIVYDFFMETEHPVVYSQQYIQDRGAYWHHLNEHIYQFMLWFARESQNIVNNPYLRFRFSIEDLD